MTPFVLDTSVAVAWYLPEDLSEKALIWRDRFFDRAIRFVVPELHYLEFGNVLRTKLRQGTLSLDLAREIFEIHLDLPVDVRQPDRRRTFEIATEYDLTTYDAHYVALAEALDTAWLTAERANRPAFARLGARVRSLLGSVD